MYGKSSQGGVKFPTGGIPLTGKPASACFTGRVSRSGEIPEPTVKVRMEENEQVATCAAVPYP